MFRIVLFEPEIPPNAGNVIRLCANTGAELHLVRPLGFDLDKRSLRRAGLDYRWMARVHVHDDLGACVAALPGTRWIAIETGGECRYDALSYAPGDVLVFGSERRGLPPEALAQLPAVRVATLPMLEGNRSLNLSNSVAVVVYEAWRQCGFPGAGPATVIPPLP
jgi:tRNA (cytidine/uridine-2'-O-)-methyltransferase